jgi:hypothetical protein
MGETTLERRGPPAGARELDRSAMGLLMATVGRIVYRDAEVTRRLLALGVGGDDENVIFERIAERLEKHAVLARTLNLPVDEPLTTFRFALDTVLARLAHASEIVVAMGNTGAFPTTREVTDEVVKEFVRQIHRLPAAEAEIAAAQKRCTEIDKVCEGFQLRSLELQTENANYIDSVTQLEKENLELRDALKRAERNAKRRGKR